MTNAFKVDGADLTNVKDKVTLITGGSSGIGLATAELLLSLSPNNQVAILDRAAPPTSLLSPPTSDRLLFHQCDITSWTDQRAGFEAAIARFGRLDVVVASAGINERGLQFFDDILDNDGKLQAPDRTVMDVTFMGVADTVKLAIYHLKSNEKGGTIIMISSLAGYMGNAGAPFYNSAKHAVVGLLRSLRIETPKLGIAISVIAPAITATPILATANGAVSAEETEARMIASGVAVNRAESVALAAGHLINNGMDSNGQSLLVQGDKMADLEKGYSQSRETLMGKEMIEILRRGAKAELHARIKRQVKI